MGRPAHEARRAITGREIGRLCALPVAAAAVTYVASGHAWPLAAQGVLTLVLVTSLGPLVYRLAYQPLADASVLLLLIVSVGVHFTLVGLGLVFFGAEGYRTPPFWDASFNAGPVTVSGQTIVTLVVSALLMAGLYVFFARTLAGKALRATAINRLGARLMGVSTEHAGRSAFSMAAFIGALSGLLIGPTTTMIYDGGFLIGLKGFVAAMFGGLASYPLAVAGALFVGLLDSFSSFWASAYKDVIVFTAIIPVLLLRSLTDRHHDRTSEPAMTKTSPLTIAGAAAVALLLVLPLLPVPEFWITLLNYIGLYAMVALGLVLLTGIAGLTSFGQAAFVGLGAYASAY